MPKALNPDYVLLLNNDTIVHKLFLNELVAAAEHDETIGMAGPKIYYCDFEGRHDVLSFTGGRIDMKRGFALFLNEREIDQGRVARVGGTTRFHLPTKGLRARCQNASEPIDIQRRVR